LVSTMLRAGRRRLYPVACKEIVALTDGFRAGGV
jgi:hypothetical protein